MKTKTLLTYLTIVLLLVGCSKDEEEEIKEECFDLEGYNNQVCIPEFAKNLSDYFLEGDKVYHKKDIVTFDGIVFKNDKGNVVDVLNDE